MPAGYTGDRHLSTAIYYLLTPGTCSALHQLPGDEVYHFYAGDHVEMLQLKPDGTGEVTIVGVEQQKQVINKDTIISYAIDLGTEVDPVAKRDPEELIAVKIDKGILIATNKIRESKTYKVKNRSEQERTLLVEHPFRPEFKLVSPEKPAEQARDVYRFEVKVPEGKTAELTVTEERDFVQNIALTDSPDQNVRIFLASVLTLRC